MEEQEAPRGPRSVRGTNPQNLMEKILRMRIFENMYWKEHCFALTADTLIDKALEIREVGGTYGTARRPTKFLMLTLRLLQLLPDVEIVLEYVRNEEFRYLRLLGAFYLRLVGTPTQIYENLEPLLADFRRIRVMTPGVESQRVGHVDEFVWDLLHGKSFSCDISLPRIPRRSLLVASGVLASRRISPLSDGEIATARSAAREREARKPEKQVANEGDDEIAKANRLRASLGLGPLK